MSLPRHLFTPAFRHQHLGRSFGAIVGIMVFIATFATAAEAALLAISYNWGQMTDSRLTVEIPAAGDEASMSQAERVRQATAILRGIPSVGLVMPLPDDEVTRLLQPWFAHPELLKNLPLPTLIDVERAPGAAALTAAQIEDKLKPTISDAHVDDHGAWMQDMWRLIHGLFLLGGATIFLTAATLVIAVSLICRAVMSAEHETISLLHLLGADDHDIARHFETQAESISWRASAAGFAVAMASTALLLFATRSLADLSSLRASSWGLLIAATAAVPIGAIFISTATARLSVLRQIRALP